MNEESIWYKVIAPAFDKMQIGEVYGTTDNVIGRKIAISASELKDVKPKAGYKLFFRVDSVSNSECNAELDSLVLSREQVGRLTRHNVSKLSVVVPVQIDKKPYAMKLICVINKAENAYKKAVAAEAAKFVSGEVKDRDMKDITLDVITGKIQNQLHKNLNKIYPTRAAEIRAVVPR